MSDVQMDSANGKMPVSITEDEAALYDRQIRLWGLDAQQRMRNATVLVVRLKGVATEAIKNIVLAGIGKLIIVDEEEVSETDLGCGFFFAEDSVGQRRVEAAKTRIQSLNPLVDVVAVSDLGILSDDHLDKTLAGVDLVCATDCQKDEMLRLNDACRRAKKAFYAGGSYGLLGFVFADLIEHEYLAQDRNAANAGTAKTMKQSLVYPSLRECLSHSWKGLSKRQTKELNPSTVFSILALWESESQNMSLGETSAATELRRIAAELIESAGVNAQAGPVPSATAIESLCSTAKHEFSPICAIVGGFLGQDILKALGAKEPPISNFLVFDGTTGGASVVPMKINAVS
ncbi:ubiquitin-like 1-activating enzyme E1 A [Rhizoctonia solani AG-1 IB]|uniref:Ubiquitin-like 1-activating enzyme E1 A n=1 Tax=Thanatephorus cucumeris (strain AG1-IB / isolate 7/3/14) TaxID=1108050 RepID=M5BRD7_THACB|nr:ubiquitin-like 1-activating enzyme E1 A [Rhizoctonia solani AG-1 IB]